MDRATELRRLFRAVDADGDGKLSKRELEVFGSATSSQARTPRPRSARSPLRPRPSHRWRSASGRLTARRPGTPPLAIRRPVPPPQMKRRVDKHGDRPMSVRTFETKILCGPLAHTAVELHAMKRKVCATRPPQPRPLPIDSTRAGPCRMPKGADPAPRGARPAQCSPGAPPCSAEHAGGRERRRGHQQTPPAPGPTGGGRGGHGPLPSASRGQRPSQGARASEGRRPCPRRCRCGSAGQGEGRGRGRGRPDSDAGVRRGGAAHAAQLRRAGRAQACDACVVGAARLRVASGRGRGLRRHGAVPADARRPGARRKHTTGGARFRGPVPWRRQSPAGPSAQPSASRATWRRRRRHGRCDRRWASAGGGWSPDGHWALEARQGRSNTAAEAAADVGGRGIPRGGGHPGKRAGSFRGVRRALKPAPGGVCVCVWCVCGVCCGVCVCVGLEFAAAI